MDYEPRVRVERHHRSRLLQSDRAVRYSRARCHVDRAIAVPPCRSDRCREANSRAFLCGLRVIASTRLRIVRPSHLTKVAMAASFATITWSAAFLMALYPRLPWLLPVHFKPNGFPNGWQFKNYWRVLMPVFVQVSIALVLLAIVALLLSRPHGDHDENAPDVRAASAAAEAVALFALIWVAFQGYVAVALTLMWRAERAGLGLWFLFLLLTPVVPSSVVCIPG